MDVGLSVEQVALGDSERSWLSAHDPIRRVREVLDNAPVTIDTAAVSHAGQSGLLGLLTPEVGGTHLDLAVLSEAHGYAASSLPIADLAIATWLLSTAGLPAADDEQLIGVALTPPHSAHTAPVPMAADMTALAVIDHHDDTDSLRVLTDPALITMTTLDLTRSWARAHLPTDNPNTSALPAGTYQQVYDALAVHRALDALGAAARLLDMTITYAAQREQFGVPIGSFQAVKHHCANMAVAIEAARATLYNAAHTLDTATDDTTRTHTASAATAYAKSAASHAASIAQQIHGGIGFTWEHDLHLLLRRIKTNENLNGTITQHRATLIPT